VANFGKLEAVVSFQPFGMKMLVILVCWLRFGGSPFLTDPGDAAAAFVVSNGNCGFLFDGNYLLDLPQSLGTFGEESRVEWIYYVFAWFGLRGMV
jgi:hypothetical protein